MALSYVQVNKEIIPVKKQTSDGGLSKTGSQSHRTKYARVLDLPQEYYLIISLLISFMSPFSIY